MGECTGQIQMLGELHMDDERVFAVRVHTKTFGECTQVAEEFAKRLDVTIIRASELRDLRARVAELEREAANFGKSFDEHMRVKEVRLAEQERELVAARRVVALVRADKSHYADIYHFTSKLPDSIKALEAYDEATNACVTR